MALQRHASDEEAHSYHTAPRELENDGDDEFDTESDLSSDDDDYDEEEDDIAPAHPVPALQEAFEESIIEATEDVQYETTPTTSSHPSAESRRKEILEQVTYDDSWNTRWNQKASAKCHPLTKLVAQIIFGMHLLHDHQAKSDAEVVKILQAHVDDIDGFLEKSTDDFDLAIQDIEERLTFLRLPMTHLDVFEIMLEDKTFRTQLVDGNEKIEKIIKRTAKAMNAALSDVQSGINATQELAKYLDKVEPDWPQDYSELPAIFAAMRGNQEGWLACFRDLQLKGNKLGVVLVQLGTTIRDMSRMAAAASRHSKHDSISAPRSKYASGGPNSKQSKHARHASHHSLDKPLPQEPSSLQPAVQATLPKPRHKQHPSIDQHRNQPNGRSQTPDQQSPRRHARTNSKMEAREPQSPRAAETSIMATFRKHSGHDASPHSTGVSDNTAPAAAVPVVDSAYSSASDPAAERRIQKRANTPARFGLFPDSKPPTPARSRAASIRATSPPPDTPIHSQAPVHTQTMSSPLTTKPSHFSLKRIFHRKPRIQEVI